MPSTTEAIFIPIDLEASLGRIEDAAMIDSKDDEMMECEQSPRTSANPFKESNTDHHIICPYPYSETESEIMERRRLHESVGKVLSLSQQTETSPAEQEWIELELIPDDTAEHDDEFSLSSEGSESLKDEDVELERIEDPVSFWDTDVPVTSGSGYPNVIPFSISFSSGCDAPDELMD